LCRSCREKLQALTEVQQEKEKLSTKKEGAEGHYESKEIERLIDGMSNLSLVNKL
jgi:hypothetical protein